MALPGELLSDAEIYDRVVNGNPHDFGPPTTTTAAPRPGDTTAETVCGWCKKFVPFNSVTYCFELHYNLCPDCLHHSPDEELSHDTNGGA